MIYRLRADFFHGASLKIGDTLALLQNLPGISKQKRNYRMVKRRPPAGSGFPHTDTITARISLEGRRNPPL